MPPGGRPLRRSERALVYAVLGVATEVVFTAARDAAASSRREARLRGHSYLWMLPIYALSAVLFEPLHSRLRGRRAAERAVSYAAAILAVELASGTAIRRIAGAVPWDYRPHTKWARARGAIRLDYAPVWAAFGLALERVDDTLARVRITATPR